MGGIGQHDIAFADSADGAVDDTDTNLIIGELFKGLADGFHRALNIALDDNGQLQHLAFADVLEEVIQGDLLVPLEFLLFLLHAAFFHQLAGQLLILNGIEDIARGGDFGQTGDLHRAGGAGLLDLLALIVGHDTHTAHGGAGDNGLAGMQGTGLDEDGGHRAAAGIQLGFDNGALGHAVGVGGQLHGIGHQQDHLQEVIQPHAGFGGNGNADGIAAPLLGDQLVFGELLLDALGIGFGLIHLIDGHDDGNTGLLGVVDGLYRLGHNAVIGGDDQHGDIGDLGATGSHGGEGGVAGGIQEGDGTAIHLHLVSTNVLGDAAGFAGNDTGFPDGIQDRGLAVIDMAHDHHDGGPGLLGFFLILYLEQAVLNGDNDLLGDLGADLHGDEGGGIKVDDIADGGHNAQSHQLLDDLAGLYLEGEGQLADGHFLGQGHLQPLAALTLQLQAAHLFLLALLAAEDGLAAAGGFLIELLLFGEVILHVAGRGDLFVPLIVLIEVDLAGAHIHGGAGHGIGGKGIFALGSLLLGRLLADLDGLAGGGRLLGCGRLCRRSRRLLVQVGTQTVALLGPAAITVVLAPAIPLRTVAAGGRRTAVFGAAVALRTPLIVAALLGTGRLLGCSGLRRRCGSHRLGSGSLGGFGSGNSRLFGRLGSGSCGLFRRFFLLFTQLEVFTEIGNGVLLRIMLHYKIQFIAGKHRLGLFGFAAKAFLQKRRQLFAVYIQVLGDLVQFHFLDHLSRSSSSSLKVARIPQAKFSSQTAMMPVALPVTSERVCIVQGRERTGVSSGSLFLKRSALRRERSSASRIRAASPRSAFSSTASIPVHSLPARRHREISPSVFLTAASFMDGIQLLLQFCHHLIGDGALEGAFQPFCLLRLAEAPGIAAEIGAAPRHFSGQIHMDLSLRGMNDPHQLFFGKMLAAAGAHSYGDLLLLHGGCLLSLSVRLPHGGGAPPRRRSRFRGEYRSSSR